MQIYTSEQRKINIIQRAVALGHSFDFDDSVEVVFEDAARTLLECCPADREEEIEIHSEDSQYYYWNDRMGYETLVSGEIIDFSNHWRKEPGCKVFFDTVIDSEGQIVALYYEVGATELNAPDGYKFDPITKTHVIDEEI